MPLTIEQGQAAGVLAAQGAALRAAIAAIQEAAAAGATIEQVLATTSIGQLTDSIALSAADTATIFNGLLSIYQNMLASVTSQLAAM